MLYVISFSWISVGKNAKPQKVLCALLLRAKGKKKKSYYNKFKFTFLINNKISVTNSWVKNDREVLNIVDGHRMTLNRQSGAIAKETTTIQYEDNYFQQTPRSISITVEGLRKIYLEYWVQFWLCMFIKEKYEECKSYPVSED